jgi:flagellar protein FliO/FliZ
MKSALLLAQKGNTFGGDLLSLVGAFLIFCCVLGLAYWFSRFLGNRMTHTFSGHNMKVIEQLSLSTGGLNRGANAQIVLLKIKEEIYLIGVSQAGVSLLAKLSGDFPDALPSPGKAVLPPAFEEVLKKYAAPRRRETEKTEGEDK